MTNRNLSYIYGLFITDGWISKKKGIPIGLNLEVSIKDKDIVEKLHNLIPYSSLYYRERDTNFKKEYQSVIFSYHNQELCLKLIEMGFPLEDKTNLARPPITPYDECCFWRGVIDGDGSLGIKNSSKKPFLSLTTKSEDLKNSFCDFLYNISKRKYNPNRNKRDNIYNIGCNGTSAKKVVEKLFYSIKEEDIYLDRKYEKMKEIIENKDT